MNPPQRIGPYRVERLLGFGSFATVWLGHDPALDARVAIKVLAENWSHDLRVRERFLDEARLLWRLDHQRLVRVHSVGELADGRPYLVMAWAEGGSLRDRLAAGPLPVGRALWVLREIAAGVAVLHANGIVHRDLTPGNVLFQPSPADRLPDDSATTHLPDDSATTPTTGPAGNPSGDAGTDEAVLIADLGLAKALAAASGLTARAGTPGYMAPEQESPTALVDARTDVFGLGRLGTTLLGTTLLGTAPLGTAPLGTTPPDATGPEDAPGPEDATRPEDGSGPSDTADGPSGAPTLRAGVPPGVAAVLRRATAHSPAERYPDAAAFAAALDLAVGAGPAGSTDQPHPVRRTRRRPLRPGTLLGAAALAVAALAGTAFTVLWPEWSGWPGRESRIGADSTGRITVALPEGWRATGSGWIGQRGPNGDLEPALVMSPDPERWPTDPAVPGAFVGLSGSLAERHDPAGYLAEHPHAECDGAPVRTVRRGAVDWYVAAFTACRSGKPVIVEAAGLAPDTAGLVYVQVAPPAGASADFVDTLLAGVRVRR